VSRGAAQQKGCQAFPAPLLMVGTVQDMAGPWASGAGFVMESVGASVFSAFDPYQAQIRKPSGPARLLPRKDGFVQAAFGTCAQAGRFL